MAYSYTFLALDALNNNTPLNDVRITHNQKICDGQHAQANPNVRCDTTENVSSPTSHGGMATIGLKATLQVTHYFYAQYPGRPSQVVPANGGLTTQFEI